MAHTLFVRDVIGGARQYRALPVFAFGNHYGEGTKVIGVAAIAILASPSNTSIMYMNVPGVLGLVGSCAGGGSSTVK